MFYRQPFIIGKILHWQSEHLLVRKKEKKSVFSIFVPYLGYVKCIVVLIVEGRNSNNLPFIFVNVIYSLTFVS